jgi:hypothetical protein
VVRMPPDIPEPSVSVYSQPPPHGPWSDSNNFGAEVAFAPDEENRQRIIKLPEWGDPVVWTVSLGIDYTEGEWPVGGPAGQRGFEIVGEVSYGVGGATQTVEVDWIQGTTFSVPMNAISVDASYFFPFDLGEGPAAEQPLDLRLSVLLGRGGSATSVPPTKFAQLLDGSPFASLDNNLLVDPPARIPKFGKRLFLHSPVPPAQFSELVSGNNYILFYSAPDVATAAFLVGTTRVTSSVLHDGVPVPAFAKYVTIQNVGGGLAAGISVLFNFELRL